MLFAMKLYNLMADGKLLAVVPQQPSKSPGGEMHAPYFKQEPFVGQ